MAVLIAAGLPLNQVRAVSFDAAGTLFHSEDGVWQEIGPELSRRGVGQATWRLAVEAVGRAGWWPEDSATAAERLTRWTQFYRRCLAQAQVGNDLSLAARAAAAATDPDRFSVFSDVPGCLARLAEMDMRLVVTSNFDLMLHDILERLDLKRWFAAVVCSFQIGAYKPASAIFEAAAGSLQLPCSAMAHVGDAPMSDVGGARSVGMVPIAIDRDDRTVTTALTLGTLDDLRCEAR